MNWYVFAIISALLATGFLLFRKKGLTQVHSTQFAATRTMVAAACGLITLPFITRNYTWTEVGMIYIVALLSTAGILFASKALKHMEISTFAPLQNLMPAFLVLLAYIFISESLTKVHLFGVALLIFGAYALEMDDKFHHLWKPIHMIIRSKYFHYAIFSVFFFSFSALFDKVVLLKHSTPIKFLALVWVFIAINLFIFHSIRFGGYKEIINTLRKTKHNAILAGVFAYLATYFYYVAASLAFIALVVPIKRLETLAETIAGGKLFHDHHLVHKVIACIIMIAGAVIIIVA
jgi:uncharacterized membrane protein